MKRQAIVIKRRHILFVAIIAITLLVYFGSAKTYRSTSIYYPVEVLVPEGAKVRKAGYVCQFNRIQTESQIDHFGIDDFSFDPVTSLSFDALVDGHYNTRWFGFVVDKGQNSVIVVYVETEEGEVLWGLADIPEKKTQIRIVVDSE